MRICTECNIEFINNRTYSNHVRWKHRAQNTKKCTHCNEPIFLCGIKNHEKKCYKNPLNYKECKFCQKQITNIDNTFCNNSCSMSYNNLHFKEKYLCKDFSYMTPEWRQNIREKTIKNWNLGVYKLQPKYFSSKIEREISNYFVINYPDQNWKTGGRLKLSDTEYLSRDLYSDDLKVCFEYDGIWHFKDINGQLARKQRKDKLLEEWCIANNYRLIRIEEGHYFGIEQVKELIFNKQELITKIGYSYPK